MNNRNSGKESGAMREILMKGLRLRAAREDGNGLCTIYKGIEKHLFIEEDREGDAVVFTRYDDIRRAIEEAGISVPDAWEIAKRNTEKHAVIRSVNEVLREMDPEYPKDDFPLYMISTDSGVYGAEAGLIPEVILRARKLTSAETMLVIPSSVSEMLFIPNASEDISRNVKEKLVREINEETTEEEKWLQDTAYELTEKDFKEMERS